MIGTRGVHFRQPRFQDDRERQAFRQERDRFFINLIRQRHESNSGYHSPFRRGDSRTSSIPLMPGMAPIMGGHQRCGFAPGMDMAPDIALALGMMGASPHMNMCHSMGMGMGMGERFAPSRPSLRHHPPYIRQRHAPSSYNSPGPPRAHPFMPPHRSAHSLFSHPPRSPFSSSETTLFGDDDSDDDDLEGEYSLPIRRSFGRHPRRSHRHSSRYPSRRRRYPSSMFEDSEDENDHYDNYEDDFDDEDGLAEYFSRLLPASRSRVRC